MRSGVTFTRAFTSNSLSKKSFGPLNGKIGCDVVNFYVWAALEGFCGVEILRMWVLITTDVACALCRNMRRTHPNS